MSVEACAPDSGMYDRAVFLGWPGDSNQKDYQGTPAEDDCSVDMNRYVEMVEPISLVTPSPMEPHQ